MKKHTDTEALAWIVKAMEKFEKETEEVVLRIPKDLFVWKREIKKIKRHTKRRDEYTYQFAYYLGKFMAYLYVLQELGDAGFVKKVEKKYGIVYYKKKGSDQEYMKSKKLSLR